MGSSVAEQTAFSSKRTSAETALGCRGSLGPSGLPQNHNVNRQTLGNLRTPWRPFRNSEPWNCREPYAPQHSQGLTPVLTRRIICIRSWRLPRRLNVQSFIRHQACQMRFSSGYKTLSLGLQPISSGRVLFAPDIQVKCAENPTQMDKTPVQL